MLQNRAIAVSSDGLTIAGWTASSNKSIELCQKRVAKRQSQFHFLHHKIEADGAGTFMHPFASSMA